MQDNIKQTDYGYDIVWTDNEHYCSKILVFEKARQNPPVLPTNIKDMYPDIYDIILNLLSHNPEERYDIEYLLSFYKFTNNYLYNRILELKNN